MMDRARYEAELSVLRSRLPENIFKFMDMDSDSPYVLIAARTNAGNIYTIRIDLAYFPGKIPDAYVTKMLKTHDGEDMDEVSASMHTLGSEYGYTHICHYGYESWTQNVSLYKVYVKCRLWLEIYERHLQTGEDMDVYLTHQD